MTMILCGQLGILYCDSSCKPMNLPTLAQDEIFSLRKILEKSINLVGWNFLAMFMCLFYFSKIFKGGIFQRSA